VKPRAATFVFSVLLLVGCGASSAAEGERTVKLGASCYRIPAWNTALMNGSAVFPFSESRKSTRSLTLQFSTEEIAARLPGYVVPLMTTGKPLRGSLVSLWIPTAAELAQVHANTKSMHHDIWYGLGEYSSRVVEPIPGTGLFRVWPLAHGYSWLVVSKRPDVVRKDTHLADDFWVGGCLRYDDGRKPKCDAKIERDGMLIEVSMNEKFLPRRAELAQYVTEKLDAWKVTCDS
jgi:hypothetical protein